MSASTVTTDDLDHRSSEEATEASLLPRFVALLTPVFAIAAGWLGSRAAQLTGVDLDETQIVAFMVTAATTALAAAWKWLHGWQQHERLVAQGLDAPRRRGPNAPMQPSKAGRPAD